MLLLDSQTIVVPNRVKRRGVGGSALTASDENEELNQSDEKHDSFVMMTQLRTGIEGSAGAHVQQAVGWRTYAAQLGALVHGFSFLTVCCS